VRSTLFTVQVRDGMARFDGHGLGHGVGLCQWGAMGMAAHGWGFRRILGHFFPRCALEKGARLKGRAR